jgi:hypothetical protein
LWSIGVAAVAALAGYVATHVKYAVGLEGYSLAQTLHLASPKMKFYDLHLNNAVWYARHAMSIDENRADFARVPWGGAHNRGPARPNEYPDWLQQVWFAGNHSDVGGSYPENEARLSDISLGWMVRAAKNLPAGETPDGFGIKLDDRYLKLNPDPLGCIPPYSIALPQKMAFSTTMSGRHTARRFLSSHSKVKQYYPTEQGSASDAARSPDGKLPPDADTSQPSAV